MANLIPAILAPDVKEFKRRFDIVKDNFDRLQIDIMDGQFVPNRTIEVNDIPPDISNNLELHLMVNNPGRAISNLSHPAVKTIIFHIEALKAPQNDIAQINSRYERGIAINPETPLQAIEPLLNLVNLVLIMSVDPGADNQEFIPQTLKKISRLRQTHPNIIIEVDGGINIANVHDISAAGADRLVVGSAIFTAENIPNTIKQLHQTVEG